MGLKKTLASLVLAGAAALGGDKARAETIESYTSGADTNHVSTYGISGAQTFRVGATGRNLDFDITNLKLNLFREGSFENNCYAEIYDAKIPFLDKYLPGGILSRGEFNGNNITSDSSGEWVTIPMSNYTFRAGQDYRVVLHTPSQSLSDNLLWFYDSSSSSYPGGEASEVTIYNGLTWQPLGGDFIFEVNGNVVPEPATIGLLSLGALGLAGKRRKKD